MKEKPLLHLTVKSRMLELRIIKVLMSIYLKQKFWNSVQLCFL